MQTISNSRLSAVSFHRCRKHTSNQNAMSHLSARRRHIPEWSMMASPTARLVFASLKIRLGRWWEVSAPLSRDTQPRMQRWHQTFVCWGSLLRTRMRRARARYFQHQSHLHHKGASWRQITWARRCVIDECMCICFVGFTDICCKCWCTPHSSHWYLALDLNVYLGILAVPVLSCASWPSSLVGGHAQELVLRSPSVSEIGMSMPVQTHRLDNHCWWRLSGLGIACFDKVLSCCTWLHVFPGVFCHHDLFWPLPCLITYNSSHRETLALKVLAVVFDSSVCQMPLNN